MIFFASWCCMRNTISLKRRRSWHDRKRLFLESLGADSHFNNQRPFLRARQSRRENLKSSASEFLIRGAANAQLGAGQGQSSWVKKIRAANKKVIGVNGCRCAGFCFEEDSAAGWRLCRWSLRGLLRQKNVQKRKE